MFGGVCQLSLHCGTAVQPALGQAGAHDEPTREVSGRRLSFAERTQASQMPALTERRGELCGERHIASASALESGELPPPIRIPHTELTVGKISEPTVDLTQSHNLLLKTTLIVPIVP